MRAMGAYASLRRVRLRYSRVSSNVKEGAALFEALVRFVARPGVRASMMQAPEVCLPSGSAKACAVRQPGFSAVTAPCIGEALKPDRRVDGAEQGLSLSGSLRTRPLSFDLYVVSPTQDGVKGQLHAIVTDDGSKAAAQLHHFRANPQTEVEVFASSARYARVHCRLRTRCRSGVHRHLIGDDVQASLLVRPQRISTKRGLQ